MIFPDLINVDLAIFILRLAVGVTFLVHAMPKLKNPKGMAAMMGGSAAMPLMLGIIETLSAIALIVGWLTQLAALLLVIVMVGAIFTKKTKWHVPFAAQDKTGWEFDFILLAASLAILFLGSGSIGF